MAAVKFTVFGSTGFIGRRVTRHLREQGFEVITPHRDIDSLNGKNLGHVIYAIGVVGGAKNRTQDMIEAHISLPARLLRETSFDSWLYLSSTRVYDGLDPGVTGKEEAKLAVVPGPGSIFALSKMLGEAVCLEHAHPAVRIARLSNVYGPDQSPFTFLGAVLGDLRKKGEVTFLESPLSGKDYVAVRSVSEILQSIALGGQERIYNVASGKTVTHAALAEKIEACGYKVNFSEGGATRTFPPVDITRIVGEFKPQGQALLDDLPLLIKDTGHA